ncbi:hypothetical protein [Haloprofundus halobius]|uniref:hypothetical protein n=1 Tax=Haloprofundus halobius TaxID=2876194 RepID=UPI001CCB8C89|nr:hypothetical protein [Haloprofundus halobius]
MGNRGQVVIEDVGVHLYTHQESHKLEELVSQALKRGQDRWEQPDYMARIVLDDLKQSDTGTKGYGISSTNYHHTYRTLRLDFHNLQVRMESIYDDEEDYVMGMKEFVDKFSSESI